ncbi:MAG: glycosyltransferase family 4 protein [Chloroflexi bacterium]|nr:glycosyltransferase family 4 protein [Chloroflexota bacterium]
MRNAVKKVYLEPAWKQPVSSQSLMQYPPAGYQFVTRSSAAERGIKLAARMELSYTVQRWLFRAVPLWLLKSYLGKFQHGPREAALTYAIVHPVFRREAYILDLQCEQPYILLGDERHFRRYGGMLRRALTSDNCRGIICYVEAGRKACLSIMGGDGLEDKVKVVNPAVPRREFVKSFDDSKVKLIFVNSGNINTSQHFAMKGGKEIVEAFLRLKQRYSNLELAIRSALPPEVRQKCQQAGNIKVIDRPVPWPELEREWKTADIFVLPTRITPFGVFLDAMSYELPIVTTDVWGNAEMVKDGTIGFLVPKSDAGQYIQDSVVHLNSPAFKRAVDRLDGDLVEALVEKLSRLIEDRELRRAMGRAGRQEVEGGKFSIERRNENLKRLFDEVTG